MGNNNNDFVQGYACAVSCIVAGHGESTATREALEACGIETKEKAIKMGVGSYDIGILFPEKEERE